MIRTVSMAEGEAGLRPLSAALEEEGFDDVGAGRMVGSFARHLMVQHRYLAGARLRRDREDISAASVALRKGVRRDIDENGDLLVRAHGQGEVERSGSSLPRSRSRPGSIRKRGGRAR